MKSSSRNRGVLVSEVTGDFDCEWALENESPGSIQDDDFKHKAAARCDPLKMTGSYEESLPVSRGLFTIVQSF